MKTLLTGTLIIFLAAQGAWAGASEADSKPAVDCLLSDFTLEQRVDCYRQAAEQGDPVSQFMTGLFYWSGRGVPRDAVEAYKWFIVAAGQEKDFAKELKTYEWQMTPEQVAQAREAARKWTESHPRSS
jgi:TPR repeat protein